MINLNILILRLTKNEGKYNNKGEVYLIINI